MIAGLAMLGVLNCALAALLVSENTFMIYVTMFFFGGLTFPLYSLCLAHANDNTSLSLVEIASGVLMMNSAGSVIGPIVVTFLIGYTSHALFIVSAVTLSLLAIWTLYRIQFHDVQRAHVEPFVGVRNTSHEIVEMVTEDGPAESASRKAS